ncbi:TPA: hypothetical protein G8N92_005050 [Salmonella enterica]|nr:hypothetical protein [Salmonella enterica]
MLVIKNVYKCSLANSGEGMDFIKKVVQDLKSTLDFSQAFISPVNKTITTEQDFDHPDYPLYDTVEVEEPDPEEQPSVEIGE